MDWLLTILFPAQAAAKAAVNSGLSLSGAVSGVGTSGRGFLESVSDTVEDIKTIWVWGVILVLFGVALYFSWPWLVGLRRLKKAV